jgi:hypothetical protein
MGDTAVRAALLEVHKFHARQRTRKTEDLGPDNHPDTLGVTSRHHATPERHSVTLASYHISF